MKLTATVDKLISDRASLSGKAEAVLKMAGATQHNFDGVYVVNSEGFEIDQELVVLVLTKEQEVQAVEELHRSGARLQPTLRQVYDQLRPDPPPPWERPAPDESVLRQAMKDTEHLDDDTQEFRLGGTA